MNKEYIHCDNCEREFPVASIINCPITWDTLDNNIPITKNFCLDCCQELFDLCLCDGDCGEEFLDDWRAENFNQLFEKTDFVEVVDLVYINKFKTLAVGYYEKDLNNINPQIKVKRKDFILSEIYYDGDEFFLIKHKNKTMSYSKKLLNEAEAFLEKAREFNLGNDWEYKTNGTLLLLDGDFIWCVIAPLVGDDSITTEEINFNNRYQKGLNFFKIRVVNNLDWTLINDKQFEDLCCDLLDSLGNFEKIRKMGGGAGELKRDITATEKIMTHFGPEYRKWLVQCKHFLKRQVNPSDLQGLIDVISAHKANGILVMTSNELTPGTKRMLEGFDEDDRHPFKAKWMERNHLEKLLEENQKILKRYFS